MTPDIVSVEVTDTIGHAQNQMARNGIRKIVVLQDHRPVGILEKWLAEKLEANDGPGTTIHAATKKYKVGLAPFGSAGVETPLDDVKSDLAKFPAALVFDSGQEKRLRGIATATDLEKVWRRM